LLGGHAACVSAASSFSSLHHDVSVLFVTLSDYGPAEAVKLGKVAVGMDVVCGSDDDGYAAKAAKEGMSAVPLITEQLIVWHRKDNELGKLKRIMLEDLEKAPQVTTTGRQFNYMGNAVSDLFAKNGMVPCLHRCHHDQGSSAFFLVEFSDSILITSPNMTDDPVLGQRSDLTCRPIEDERRVTWLATCADYH
jgi:hypothetical protein